MAEALIKYETIDANQLKEIMAGNEPTPPEDWESIKIVKTLKDKTKPDQTSQGSSNESMGGDIL